MRASKFKTQNPFVLESDNLLFVDVDETLVFWGPKEHPEDEQIWVEDAYMPGERISFIKHKRNIDLVKRNALQGRTIVVWSHGGYDHARNVVKALGLDPYVSLVMSKPHQYVDDIAIENWGLKRVYLSKLLPKHTEGPDIEEV